MPELYEPRGGDPVSASQQVELVRLAKRKFSGPGIIETPDGIHFRRLPVKKGMGIQLRLKHSAADFADYLVCRTWDGTTEGESNVLVAKPWILRRTPFDQQVREDVRYEYSNGVTRNAIDATDPTEQLIREEQIHPRYLISDILVAVKVSSVLLTVGEIDVTLLDMNVDCRGWRTFYEWL